MSAPGWQTLFTDDDLVSAVVGRWADEPPQLKLDAPFRGDGLVVGVDLSITLTPERAIALRDWLNILVENWSNGSEQ